MSFYGKGFTEYLINNDRLVSNDQHWFAAPLYRIPLFVFMLEHGFAFENFLVYDNDEELPHITAYVDGKEAFSILLSNEQYQQIEDDVYTNRYLEMIMDLALDKETYKDLLKAQKWYECGGALPEGRGELELFDKYVIYLSSLTFRRLFNKYIWKIISGATLFWINIVDMEKIFYNMPQADLEIFLLRGFCFYFLVGEDFNKLVDRWNGLEYIEPSFIDWINLQKELLAIGNKQNELRDKYAYINKIRDQFYAKLKIAAESINLYMGRYYDDIYDENDLKSLAIIKKNCVIRTRKVLGRFNQGIKNIARIKDEEMRNSSLDALLADCIEELYIVSHMEETQCEDTTTGLEEDNPSTLTLSKKNII